MAAASAAAVPTSVTVAPVDVGHRFEAEDLFAAPNGDLFFNDYWWPEGSYRAVIGRIDRDGHVEELEEGLSPYSSPADFVAGPDGKVWFADSGEAMGGAAVGRVEPDGSIEEFRAGLGGSRPQQIVAGPDSRLWFTAGGPAPAIGFSSLAGQITAFDLPDRPWDVAAGPDREIWFTYGRAENGDQGVGRIVEKEDGWVATVFHAGLREGSDPYELVSSGGFLWFSDLDSSSPAIGRVSPDGTIEEFSAGLGARSEIGQIVAGPDGNVWFSDSGEGKVGRITSDGQITEFGNEMLSQGWELRYIAPGPDGNVWFTYNGGKVGKVTPGGELTVFDDGLGPELVPEEIVAGPDGELSFLGEGLATGVDLGRIVPGDDSPPPASPPAVAPGPGTFGVGRFAIRSGRISVAANGDLAVRGVCVGPPECDGVLNLTAFHRGWRVSGRMVASGNFVVPAGQEAGVRLRLDKTGRRLLAAEGGLKVRLTLVPHSGIAPANQLIRLRPKAPPRR